ncbi:type IV toxin-antitoxin system AbiEi family antitoxin domain-containing protein [Chitinophaga qingshengii]|uniref:Transcriptional regulator n=1 Tax=Chitinophaga qingshengii TaxID=1569794 RepID=A0ABR7TS32_9BACT|nr:hypothetical protein [Chitinophaga qingshengii]MBC9932276.1 hypothetical protein [Chitinophaga qingshengii]
MNINTAFAPFQGQLLTQAILLSILKGYSQPTDKIQTLVQEKVLFPMKEGLYIPGPALKIRRPERFLVANHIFGPSYVSLDVALSYHGLIPERVFEVSSMTTQASCQFDTPVNRYAYYHLPLPYYTYGIKHTELWEDQFALVATPEKALSDKIITTPGIILRSRRMAIEYLTENLRIDEDNLAMLNVAAIQEWLPYSTKKNSLRMVIEAIKRL